MRILLDANVPQGLKRAFSGHDVSTAREQGLNALPDGPLLAAISGRFDVLVTLDKSMRVQQRLQGRDFAVVVLRARSNRIADLIPLVPAILRTLDHILAGEIRELKE